MLNVNRLLENSVRRELMGTNMFSFTMPENPRGWRYEKRGRFCAANIWDEPSPLLSGTLGISHETDIKDALTLSVKKAGRQLRFHSYRHSWTPAYTETYYRCDPEGEYPRSGLVALKETKCITADDIFVSHITLFNDDNQPVILDVDLVTPFKRIEDGAYRVKGKTLPRAMKVQYELDGTLCVLTSLAESFSVKIPAGQFASFRVCCVYVPGGNTEKAASELRKAIDDDGIFLKAEREYNLWFERNAPAFDCDNPDIKKVYYYRWHLVRKNTFTPSRLIPSHFIKGECMYESATGSWYGCSVGLPVPMQIDEARWQRGGSTAGSQIENWRLGGGDYRGYIQYTPMAVLHYYRLHRDPLMLKGIYTELKEYTLKKLDADNIEALPQTRGSWPTGAEYQPSFYQHRDIPWDYRYDQGRKTEVGGEVVRLYRLDEISFTVGNLIACRRIAEILGYTDDAKAFGERADALTRVLKNDFFHRKRGVFLDKDVRTGKLCDEAACYDSFTPFMWGIVQGEEYDSSVERLLTKDKFLSEMSVTTVERTSPMFWFDNAVVGPAFASKSEPDFYGCCWNGPVWPYADTQVISAVGEVAGRRENVRESFLELFDSYTALHFYCGDKSVPDIVEHYRPTDGFPFSQTHDYFHSCYIDILMTYWAGIRVFDNGEISFNPLCRVEFTVSGVQIGGRDYTFRQYRKGEGLCCEYFPSDKV